jgi:hypothetical protein
MAMAQGVPPVQSKIGLDGRPLRAAGAVRISEEDQSVWSATTQREALGA